MTIILHYLEHSRARRIVWMLEELGLEYETKVYHRDPKTFLAPPDLKQIHPAGKSPILEDNGKVYAESALILDYLIHTYGKDSDLTPKNYDEDLEVRYHEYAAESNIQIYGFYLGLNKMIALSLPWGLRQIADTVLGFLGGKVAGPLFTGILKNLQTTVDKNGGYFVNGRVTAADVMYDGTFDMLRMLHVLNLEKDYPGLAAWHKRISQRPAYKRALELEKKWNTKKL